MSTSRLIALTISLACVAIIAICVTTIVIVVTPASPTQTGWAPDVAAVQPVEDGNEQPRTEAGARAAAQVLLDSYAAGNYAAFWDGWTIAAQSLIARDDYVRLFELCKPIAQGLRYTVQSVTVQGDTARVQVTRFLGAFTYDFKHEDGRWRYVPEADTQAEYRSKSVDQLAAEKQATGTCANRTATPAASVAPPPAALPTATSPTAAANQQSRQQAQPTASGERKVLLADSGNGRKNTAVFTADASWEVHYTYDCSTSPIGTGGMSATLLDGTKYVALVVNETGASADKTTPQYTAGTFHLEVTGSCPWTIEVIDVP